MLLQLFDGEGGAADGTGSAPATQNNTADNTAPATQDGAQESTAEDLDKEFKALIKDKYKNAYQKHINAAMQKRFRADEAAQAQYDRVLPLLDMLGEKYGADATDPEALMQALEDDNSFYEQESVEKGVPIESLKQMHKLERENAAFRQEMQERERQDAAAQQYQQWLDESEAVKSLYGDAFDLDAELADPEFVSLLKCPGITLKTAFEARHLTELTGGAMQFAAQRHDPLTRSCAERERIFYRSCGQDFCQHCCLDKRAAPTHQQENCDRGIENAGGYQTIP
jgi:hypothetical protein